MKAKEIIKLIRPKPYEVVGVKFDVFGKVPKSWLLHGKYGLSLNWMNIKGVEIPMSPLINILPSLFAKFKKTARFGSSIDLSYFQTSEHPRGLIIEISSHNSEHFFFLPLIVSGTNKIYDAEQEELKEKLSDAVKITIKRMTEWNNYRNELAKIRNGVIFDKEIQKGIFEILENSESHFKPFIKSEYDEQEKELVEKYNDAITWRGPLLGVTVGQMSGFELRVNSGDHDPKHIHVIHKSRGIHARFSYPKIELISYKGRSNVIGKKESEEIRQFFGKPENLQKLEAAFQKQISIK